MDEHMHENKDENMGEPMPENKDENIGESMSENMHGSHEEHKFMHNTFWVDNQVSFTFDPSGDVEDIIKSLNLPDLSTFLREQGFRLSSFAGEEHSRVNKDPLSLLDSLTPGAENDDAEQEFPGIYVFPRDPETGKFRVVTFFHFDVVSTHFTHSEMAQGEEAGNVSDENHNMRQSDENGSQEPEGQPVPRLVALVNDSLPFLRRGFEGLNPIPITSAAPNWLWGACDDPDPFSFVATGCPLLPPIPVAGDVCCSSSPGLWPISLPHLPYNLKRLTGDGVTIFVLDTLPKRENITRAAQAAGEHNLLLLDLENNVRFSYPYIPDPLNIPNPSQPVTGKDITGRLIGFRMPDHGLFVAGIIRDVAPDAQVECIRVLNDWCVGTTQLITAQLYKILHRICSRSGDLRQKDVIVNLSLVIPGDEDALMAGIHKNHLQLVREPLFYALNSLVELGVVFVASAGNEGDQRYQGSPARPGALYPAAFAYDPRLSQPYNVIPVGAVDRDGNATTYSCYPGEKGVATYGGEVPGQDNQLKEGDRIIIKDPTALDAVIGVYTSLSYPALYYKDPEPTYPIPNAHGWAYWIGTSFASPIASAVAARVLELRRRVPAPSGLVNPAPLLSQAATDSTLWTNLSSIPGEKDGPMIKAVQCGQGKCCCCGKTT